MDDTATYTTVQATPHPHKYLAVVMAWDKTADGYIIRRASAPLKRPAAEELAKCWATVDRLEYRP